MTRLTRPAEISGVSAGLFPETAAGNRAYFPFPKGEGELKALGRRPEEKKKGKM